MTILIKNGRIINPATQMDEVQDLLIVDGKVAEIGKLQKKKQTVSLMRRAAM